MANIVLVHGGIFKAGGSGGRSPNTLNCHCHEVFTPTLSGAGERTHLLNPSIGLNTYVEDVANLIFYESLQNVVLVGHSYAGMIITAVARKLPRRIAHLVYLDAVVPQPGQSFLDIAGIEFVRLLESQVTGWQVRPWPLPAFGIESEADRDWFETRLVPFPLKAFKSIFPPGPFKRYAHTHLHPLYRARKRLSQAHRQAVPGRRVGLLRTAHRSLGHGDGARQGRRPARPADRDPGHASEGVMSRLVPRNGTPKRPIR